MVFRRKIGETILIGSHVQVTVLRVISNEALLRIGSQPVLELWLSVGAEFVVSASIKIVVVMARPSQVKLGIEAPKEVAVHRQELWESVVHSELSLQRGINSETGGNYRKQPGRATLHQTHEGLGLIH